MDACLQRCKRMLADHRQPHRSEGQQRTSHDHGVTTTALHHRAWSATSSLAQPEHLDTKAQYARWSSVVLPGRFEAVEDGVEPELERVGVAVGPIQVTVYVPRCQAVPVQRERP